MKNLPKLFKALTFVFSLVGLLSILNIVYLKPWNNPHMAKSLQQVSESGSRGPIITGAARILKDSVPAGQEEIPVSLGE